MATEITGDTPKYLTWQEVLQALLDGKTVEYALAYRAADPSSWVVLDPTRNFYIVHSDIVYRIKPKPKVKKWKWIVENPVKDLSMTSGHYASPEEYKDNYPSGLWTAIQKIDSTMIEVEE